jgi:ferric-dicitrate binding protein FerR (iron transport regulator)
MESNNTDHIWQLIARKLSGEATSLEIADLEELLRNNPHVNYSKEILNDLWESNLPDNSYYTENKFKELVLELKNMGIDEGKFTVDDHFINNDSIAPASTKFKKGLFAVVITTIIAILTTAIYLNYNNTPAILAEVHSKSEISTKNGSKTNLVLPDGTKVWLNAGSEMTYDKNYGIKIREVTLNGEAYFDVKKNAEKPFIIHTAKMDIKVLGTAFNVKCYKGEKTFETSLIRGSIEVTLKDRLEKILMKPNEKLIINTEEKEKITAAPNKILPVSTSSKPIILLSNLTIYSKDNTVVETAWVQNRLVFVSETFEDIALMMERWYGIKIIFTNEVLKKAKFTGSFEKESITEALNAMQLLSPFNYSIKNNTVTISAKNQKNKQYLTNSY